MELPTEAPRASSTKTIQYTIETRKLSYILPPAVTCTSLNWPWSKHRAISGNCILRNVDCQARPGEITAIAGPSGAGKTTLLQILAATTTLPSSGVSGHVLVNGQPVDAAHFRRVSGYVTQDDFLFPLLTVEETLLYSARLRLHQQEPHNKARVRELLKKLGLEHIAQQRIGGGNFISGGEKRRVSIGVDLVHDPPVLLLDEPTSGLDSASALHLTHLLKSMATTQGKTIVLSIHQPGFRILELFDQILLLANGNVVHHGSIDLLEHRLRRAGHPVPWHVNVLEFAIEVIHDLGVAPAEENHTTEESIHDSRADELHINPQIKEVVILSQRFSKNIWRTTQLLTARMVQALVAGIMLGSIFMNAESGSTRVGFFGFSLTYLLSSSTTEGLAINLQERSIVMKETARGAYRISSYVISNALTFLPFLMVVALLYAVPVYWLVGLRREIDAFLYFSLVVWMVMLMSNSLVACFSALVPNFITGTSLIAGLIGCFFLFSGYFILKEDIPSYWKFMHYLSLFKYPLECLMINEYGGGTGETKCLKMVGGECHVDGGAFLRMQGLRGSRKWSNIGVMLTFILAYRSLSLLILMCRSYKNNK